MARKTVKAGHRTTAQLREHYEIEKELASRLRNASEIERRHLYSSVYNELFQRLPQHPGLIGKSLQEQTRESVFAQMKILKHYLNKETTFLEVGPGDCALSLGVAKLVKQVYAIDVSDQIIRDLILPENFEFILSDGCSISIPQGSVDLAYSSELMEHLHPDDALVQLHNIYNALTFRGVYICITPNKLKGPHDISKYFDTMATGLHLKEYTISELSNLFKDAGFSKIKVLVGGRGIHINTPVFPSILCEKLLCMFPYTLRKSIAVSLPFRAMLGIRLVGIK
jgi:hypothetical protein